MMRPRHRECIYIVRIEICIYMYHLNEHTHIHTRTKAPTHIYEYIYIWHAYKHIHTCTHIHTYTHMVYWMFLCFPSLVGSLPLWFLGSGLSRIHICIFACTQTNTHTHAHTHREREREYTMETPECGVGAQVGARSALIQLVIKFCQRNLGTLQDALRVIVGINPIHFEYMHVSVGLCCRYRALLWEI